MLSAGPAGLASKGPFNMTSHLLGIFLAAVAMFALGAVWYSPLLFAKPWGLALGIDMSKQPDSKAMLRLFAATFVLLLLCAAVLDCFIASWAAGEGLSHGLAVGFLGGLIAAFTTGINYVYEGRSLKLFCINAGYDIIGFCMMGVVLALL